MRETRAEAKRLGVSLAAVLGRPLRVPLAVEASKPWMRYAGMIDSGDAQASQRIDDMIYGQNDQTAGPSRVRRYLGADRGSRSLRYAPCVVPTAGCRPARPAIPVRAP
jgi:hypothetical protein